MRTRAAMLGVFLPALVYAQTKPSTITLDFPPEGIEVKTLAEIASKRLGFGVLYDETIAGKRIILRAPKEVPESALLGILQSALRMKQLVLVDSDTPGFKQIVPAGNLAAMAQPAAANGNNGDASAITQVIPLQRTDPARIIESVRPLLTQPGGNVQAVAGQRLIVVSDYVGVVKRVEQIVAAMDDPSAATEVRFVPLKEADAPLVAAAVSQLLTQSGGASSATVTPDERLNQLIVVAPAGQQAEIAKLVAGFDAPMKLETRVYRLKSAAPERVDKLMRDLVGTAAKRQYQASIDEQTNALVVAATPDIHERLDAVLKQLDTPTAESASPIKFYKLKNTKAADVLATLSGLVGETGSSSGDSPGAPAMRPLNGDRASANDPMAGPRSAANDARPSATPPGALTVAPITPLPANSPLSPGYGTASAAANTGFVNGEPAMSNAVKGKNLTVAADVNTNSIIVIAPPQTQQLYADLIARLDTRRPQVQIECTVVTLDTTDGYSFGVDIAKLGGFGNNALLTFSSFGVAQVDPASGRLTPTAGTGGNFALLSPGIADVVLRTIANNTHARLVSAPQLLVNDNAKGQLQSVAQEPYAEILDTATSQSRTGLGGQAQAGTTISVQPAISEDDYLQLDYSIELSSFTGAAAGGLPPPSQKNSVSSRVTIPDGYTIVVGGLSVRNLRETITSLPGIIRVPVLNWLFGARSKSTTETTLFVFLRPTVLRDDKFEDLKYLSGRKADAAGVRSTFPKSSPVPMK